MKGLPKNFQGKDFKDRVKDVGCGLRDQLTVFLKLVGGKVIGSQGHSLMIPAGLWSTCLWEQTVNYPHLVRIQPLQNNSKAVAQNIIYSP